MPVTAYQVRSAGADKIYDPTDAAGAAVEVTIQNLGPNTIYVETSDSGNVTTATGLAIPSGQAYTTDGRSEVWAIAASALQVSPADTRVSVESRYQ